MFTTDTLIACYFIASSVFSCVDLPMAKVVRIACIENVLFIRTKEIKKDFSVSLQLSFLRTDFQTRSSSVSIYFIFCLSSLAYCFSHRGAHRGVNQAAHETKLLFWAVLNLICSLLSKTNDVKLVSNPCWVIKKTARD